MLLGGCEVGSALCMAELDKKATAEARTGSEATNGLAMGGINNWGNCGGDCGGNGSDTYREGPWKPQTWRSAA
jgi:hypothetical protein